MEAKRAQEIIEKVLTQLVFFLANTGEDTQCEEYLKIVSRELDALKNTGNFINSELVLDFFEPGAPLQDSAIENGWGPEYSVLAENFGFAWEELV